MARDTLPKYLMLSISCRFPDEIMNRTHTSNFFLKSYLNYYLNIQYIQRKFCTSIAKHGRIIVAYQKLQENFLYKETLYRRWLVWKISEDISKELTSTNRWKARLDIRTARQQYVTPSESQQVPKYCLPCVSGSHSNGSRCILGTAPAK